jgi:hypothetical protein
MKRLLFFGFHRSWDPEGGIEGGVCHGNEGSRNSNMRVRSSKLKVNPPFPFWKGGCNSKGVQ